MLLAILAQTICLTCNAPGQYRDPRISADGRYVAFVAGSFEYPYHDVEVADVDAGTTKCLSCDLTPYPWSGSGLFGFSRDGRYVTFVADRHYYLADRLTGIRSEGPYNGILSGDGNWIVFQGDDGQVYMRDRESLIAFPVTAESEPCTPTTVSETARFIVYTKTSGTYFIDRATGISEQLDAGTPYFSVKSVSTDGRYFLNQHSGCGTAVYDRRLGTTDCLGSPFYTVYAYDMSPDGRYVTADRWNSYGGTSLLFDRELGTSVRMQPAMTPVVSADGSRVCHGMDGNGYPGNLYVWFR